MRRRLAAFAVLVAVTVAAASCSGDPRGDGPLPDDTPSAGASASPGASGASGAPEPGGSSGADAALGPMPTAKAGGNAQQVCRQALAASTQGTQAFVTQLSTIVQAEGTGDANGKRLAEQKARSALDTWAGELRKSADAATDAQLKTTLGFLAGEIGKMTPNIESIDDERLGAIQDRLDALCPE